MRNSMRPSLQSVAARGLDVQRRLRTCKDQHCECLYAEPAQAKAPGWQLASVLQAASHLLHESSRRFVLKRAIAPEIAPRQITSPGTRTHLI